MDEERYSVSHRSSETQILSSPLVPSEAVLLHKHASGVERASSAAQPHAEEQQQPCLLFSLLASMRANLHWGEKHKQRA